MATLAKVYTKEGVEIKTEGLTNRYNKFIESLQPNYFGLISMAILIGSIIGGIAAMYIFEDDAPLWQFALCLGFSMANNVFAIAQAPIKLIWNTFMLTIIVNAAIIVAHLI